jgi:hypothetical protein
MTQDPEDEQLVRRALAAWYRSDCDGEYDPVVLAPPISGVPAEHAGKRYVLIVNGPGVPVAVYRVRNDGVLKSLRQWPKALDASIPSRAGDGMRIAFALLAAQFRCEPEEVMNLVIEEGRSCLDEVIRMLVQIAASGVGRVAGPGDAEELAKLCSAHAVRLAAGQNRADPQPGES